MSELETSFLASLQEALARRKDREHYSSPQFAELPLREKVETIARTMSEQLMQPVTSKDVGFDLSSGLLCFGEYFKTLPPETGELIEVIDHAKSNYYAFQALRFVSMISINVKPTVLTEWDKKLFLGIIRCPPKPKGPDRYKNTHRNMVILSIIRNLEQAGISPTRNDATQVRESGCDLISQASARIGYAMSYSAIEAIWKNRQAPPKLAEISNLIAESVLRSLRGLSEK